MTIRARRLAAMFALSTTLSAPLGVMAQTEPAPPPLPPPSLSATSPTAAHPAATAAPAEAKTYILGPADVIEVSIPGRTDFTTRARISEQGTIELPFLGAVDAADRTTLQLADQIAKALDKGGFFSKPIITVEIASYASKYVTVLGDVTNPGLVPVDRPYHLSEIMARVGGVKDTGADYVVLRPEKGAERHLSIESLATGDGAQDPYVSPGDKIYSPKAELFYISGQVNAPGTYPVVGDMTIRQAIARGGGVNAEGSLGKVDLTRHGAKLALHDLNGKLQPGDIVVVGERLF
jgi:polysaccharide biosynthesis/export protein